jgi:hypothetical protein
MDDKTHELLVEATPGLIADDETRLRALLSQALDKAFRDALGAASSPLQQEGPRCKCGGNAIYICSA